MKKKPPPSTPAEDTKLHHRILSLCKSLSDAKKELKIESSLEKVRKLAMRMKKRDDMLAICRSISQQLANLDVKEIRNVQTAIFYPDKGSYMNYEFYAKHNKTMITDTLYTDHKIAKAFGEKMLKGKGEFYITHIKGKKVKDWLAYQKTTNVFIDKYLRTASSLNYYWYSLGPVALGISTYHPLTKEEMVLFKRFLKVFELAYRRYLDIEKAEAQARAKEIELAVEKVRARALAMHKSVEIHEVVRALRHELFGLKLEGIMGATICLKQADGQVRLWDITDIETTGRYGWDILFDMDKIDPRLWVKKIWVSKKKIITTEQDWNDLKRTLKWLGQYDKKTADEIIKLLKSNKINHGWHRAVKLFDGLLITDFANEPTAEMEPILLKMGAAFDLAYKRFLDLKKAEAQTREAEIELGLERVRARAMAMQHSNELADLVAVVFKELTHLDFPLTSSIIWIHDHANANNTIWIASAELNKPPQPYNITAFHNEFFKSIIHAWKAKDSKWAFTLTGKQKKEFEKAFFKEIPGLPTAFRKALTQPERVVFSASFNNFGALEIAATEPLNEEKFEILHRFGKVFDLSYTRFNDLKKAEAQAREAQIEAALEKVRARTMGMQHSNELQQAAALLFHEIKALGVPAFSCGYNIFNKGDKLCTAWMSNPDGSGLNPMENIPLTEDANFIRFYESKQKNEEFYVLEMRGERMQEHYRYLRKVSKAVDEAFNQIENAGLSLPEAQIHHLVNFSQGNLMFITLEPCPDAHDIFKRFGKVFEQTYTRFIDLQKAEAQAREAEIELALERVRARTMAMHHSDELSDCAELLFSELTKLGGSLWSSGFAILKDDDLGDGEYRTTDKKGIREEVTFIPNRWDATMEYLYEGWKKKEQYRSYDLGEEEIRQHYANMLALPKSGHVFQVVLDAGLQFPDWQQMHAAYFKQGYLLVISLNHYPYPELLVRFAKVFEQTYTRFLDLQKAEAQAREAQIETALERVRSRSMGMQKSKELKEVIKIVYQQLIHLKINLDHAGFIVDYTPKGNWTFWIADEQDIPSRITHPYFESVWANQFNEAKERGEDLFITNLNFEEKNKFYQELLSYVPGLPEAARDFYLNCPGLAATTVLFKDVSLYMENFSGIPYTDEENKILMRFGKVFQQTYTRFLDLQKAEAQAREAQIEAALERVRARTMAMHNSAELSEVSSLLYKELQSLGVINFINCGYVEIDEPSNIQHAWMTIADGSGVNVVRLPLTGDKVFDERYDAWKRNEKIFHQSVGGELLKNHIELSTQHYRKTEIDELVRTRFVDPTIFYCSNFSHGYLHIVTDTLLSEENESLLIRFTRVFEMTYKRFLDLQKAEAQAREAQIEVALERVRAKAMAMHSSKDLSEALTVFYRELKTLGVTPRRCGIALMDKQQRMAEVTTMNTTEQGDSIEVIGNIKMSGHQILDEIYENWLIQEEYHTVLKGNEIKAYYQVLKPQMNFPDYSHDVVQYGYYFMFSEGDVYAWTEKELSEDELKIFRRFTTVISLTYKRYKDLQQAEAQAREAQIEAALEKVRSRSLAMQVPGELREVAELLRKEMAMLGVEELETSSIYIVDKAKKQAECWYAIKDVREENTTLVSDEMTLLLPVTWVGKEMWKFYQSGQDQVSILMKGEQRKEWIDYCAGHSKVLQGYYGGNIPERTYHLVKFNGGYMGAATPGNISDESWDLLKRASNVFSFAYTRFKDLQDAAARAREAQIELALERIRGKVTSMQESSELLDIVVTMRGEFVALGHEAGYFWYMRWLPDKYEKAMTSGDGTRIGMVMELPRYIHGDIPLLANWEKSEEPAVVYAMDVDAAIDYVDKMIRLGDFKQVDHNAPTLDDIRHIGGLTFVMARTTHGEIGYSLPGVVSNPPEGGVAILVRFAAVFDLAYRRFEDLKEAERSNRETQIELALERVRARTMAMQKSDELPEAANTLFLQIQSLGIPAWSAGYCIWSDDKQAVTLWMSTQSALQPPFTAPTTEDELFIQMRVGEEKDKALHIVEMGGDDLVEHYKYMHTLPVVGEILDSVVEAGHPLPAFQIMHYAYFPKGFLLFITYEPVPEAHDIFIRFAKVFDQTYTRFLDLQKAEAQAREAQIESALERVRSRSIAMRRSEEIADIVGKIFSELRQLNLVLNRVLIWTFNDPEKYITWWSANPEVESNAESYRVDYNEQPVFINFLQAWKERIPIYLQTLSGDAKRTWEEHLFENTEMSRLPMAVRNGMREEGTIFTTSVISDYGLMMVGSFEPLSDANIDITQRFGRVFQQSYTRYLDVQKAEAQAREAQIDAALEKVRAKAMAMHKSEDFNPAANTIFEELEKLQMGMMRCGIGILHKDKRTADVWTTAKSDTGMYIETSGDEPMDIHPLLQGDFDAWLRQEDFSYTLEGKDLEKYYRVLTETNFQLPESASFSTIEKNYKQFYYATPFEAGTLFAFRETEFTSEARIVMKRFANVFNLTYKRFLDLQRAEAQAREAQIEAGLERVRSSSLSMETTNDLQKVVDIVFAELNKLNIGMDHTAIVTLIDDSKDYNVWVGSADANFTTVSRIPYNNLTQVQRDYNEMIEKRPSVLSKVYTGETKKEYSRYLFSQTGFKDNTPEKELRLMMDGDSLITSIVMLENTGIQIVSYKGHKFSENDENILNRFTNVFEQAYIRFMDIKKSEEQAALIKREKERLEKTLGDLQATQKQLIQSEKMASLGELTAGIAHEIQNPLNFVNNFSDVSNELLDEMKEELAKGNTQIATEIANDIKQNLEKILHHGKRADGIVKGMLQHSRSSSGQKELTDINVLADEYLRLAYHGLRAKDKSFNAKFETDFDNSIEKINVVPQEIGRVILNLINNAFYAVSEKKKRLADSYEPLVTVTTKKLDDKIEIKVADNGNGIPDSIKEKIFQPFFTTKPTGSGTGLGLSLSYDIVKAHGGEIKVNTKENDGTEFIIQLPNT